MAEDQGGARTRQDSSSEGDEVTTTATKPADNGVTGKGHRLTAAKRDQLTRKAVKWYGQGKSVRYIAEQVGMSYGWVHRQLDNAGVTFRQRGGPTRGKGKRK